MASYDTLYHGLIIVMASLISTNLQLQENSMNLMEICASIT